MFLYSIETDLGRADLRFLERSFQGLMLNFNWWVNRKDPKGRNVFAGGFLGLDNIGVFDRSAPLPSGGYLDQADGTAWMAFFCLCMLEIALILTEYDSPCMKTLRFDSSSISCGLPMPWTASAITTTRCGTQQEGFFYDLLHLPNGRRHAFENPIMVGLLPLCAATVFEPSTFANHPRIRELIDLFHKRHPEV